ncbi:MAG: YbjN domain-containing protein [Clostridium sp.]|nr:YbjN domain-containing protein [Clostridium sp.]
MTKKELVLAKLDELGYKPKIDDDGDIELRYQMKSIYFMTGDDEEKYVVAIFPQFLGIDEGDESLILATCNKLAREFRFAKVYVDHTFKNVSASCEFFYTDDDSLKDNLNHSLNILGVVRSAFLKAKQELSE